jgi:hypothetical protein
MKEVIVVQWEIYVASLLKGCSLASTQVGLERAGAAYKLASIKQNCFFCDDQTFLIFLLVATTSDYSSPL